ncbi:PAS domain S-box-containing protein [Halogranum gelatinilyticum]|uniref:PAS domain S-box-containing protein n=1 Tax=Halogranum gelatinilyticum TaxID=660521 RepID=A0A1G9UAG6_9EURY|nr:PAS domain-containing protein [Halogranum gelatinilyticum]SDM56535.1 PAS domain S-box-containing protein [Halogranum gelatinilyticum]
MSDESAVDRSRVALCVARPRNRELLAELLAEYDPVDVTESVPDGVDLCIVDEGGLDSDRGALTEWKRREQPTYAPVLLLTEARNTEAAWSQHDGALGERVDAIQSIPAPKRAIRSRVEGLLRSRQYALTAQERLEQLELYERAMDGATVGITIADATDPELPLVYANDEFCEITGYPIEEAIGRNCRYLQGEDTDPATVDRIREAIRAETTVSVDIRNYRKSGELFWNALEIAPVRDEAGNVTHFLGFQRDITEQKKQEMLLAQHERIAQSVGNPVFVLDEHDRVLYANSALERAFGVTPDAIEGEPLTVLFDERQARSCRAALSALDATGDTQMCELTVVDRPGRERAFQFHFQQESLLNAPATRTVVITQEVTSIRQHQNRLSVLDRVLRHNIRNKLNVVLAYADEVRDRARESDSESLAEASSRIEMAAMELLDLSEAARQFNQSIDPEADNTQVADLADVARRSARGLRSRFPQATIEVNAPETAWANCPKTITLCLAHLVENAVAHHDREDPRIVITVDDDTDGDDDSVELRVSDDGPGIPEAERLAFVRGSESPLQHTQGIGLWLVKWAVMSSGGTFSFTDNEPRGTTVVLGFNRPSNPPSESDGRD